MSSGHGMLVQDSWSVAIIPVAQESPCRELELELDVLTDQGLQCFVILYQGGCNALQGNPMVQHVFRRDLHHVSQSYQ